MTFNIQELDRRIEAMRQEWGTPALSLAVVKDDETIYARGFGERRAGLRADKALTLLALVKIADVGGGSAHCAQKSRVEAFAGLAYFALADAKRV